MRSGGWGGKIEGVEGNKEKCDRVRGVKGEVGLLPTSKGFTIPNPTKQSRSTISLTNLAD